MPNVVLAILILAPVAITYFLKSNAALSFLALCSGFVLSTSVVGDLKHLLSETNLSVANDTLGAILVAAPFLITLLLCRHNTGKGIMLWGQLIAALAAGGLLALSLGPLLSSTQFNVLDSSFWNQLQKIQAATIGVGAIVSLFLVWLGGTKRFKKH